jgi:serine phosphatase RsbU (regulator of sigma subunit)
VFFGLLFMNVFGQSDSLTQALIVKAANEPLDTVRERIFFEIYIQNKGINPIIAREYIYKTNDILKQNTKTHPAAYFYSMIECSAVNRTLGNYAEALPFINDAFRFADSLNNAFFTAIAYDEKGLLLMYVGDYEKAKECFLKEIQIKKIRNPKDSTIFGTLNNIAIIFANTGNLPKAEEYFRIGLQTAIKQGHDNGLGNGYNNLGVIKIMQKKLDSVMFYLEKGMYYRRKIKDIPNLSGSYNNIALYYKELKNYKLALKYADTALQLATNVQAMTELIEVLDTYYTIYQGMGDYKNAFQYYKQRADTLKKIENKRIDRKISEYESSFNLQKKQEELNDSKNQLLLKESEESRQKLKINLMVLVLLLSGGGIFMVVSRNKKISAANGIISEQKKLLEEKHKDITDSINYAQKIQTALIVSEKTLASRVDNVFVMFKPRDIVSGDFYWYGEKNGYKLLAVADCTGHGVPGAFMSMIGITLLNQIVNEKGIISPSEILNKLREGIISSLNITGDISEKRDGMDVALIAWNKEELIYAGANNPCVVISKGEIIELKPDKQPIGLYEKQVPFSEQKIALKSVDSIYMFTDGIVDQFGGPDAKKVKIKLFKEWLSEIATYDSLKQKTELETKFNNWKKNAEQTDDILVIGIKA